MATKPLLRIVKEDVAGDDVVCIKRCLARAGFGELEGITKLFGPYAIKATKSFQKSRGLLQDGVIGRTTWTALQRWADSRAWYFYDQQLKKMQKPETPPIIMGSIILPQYFRMTHQTAGLPGYPAIDVFGKPYTSFGAPEAGRVIRLTGKSPALGGKPGGAYGWTTYLKGQSGAIYFMTHQAYRSVVLGQRVVKGQKLGAMCDSAVAHMASNLTHIHLGKHV